LAAFPAAAPKGPSNTTASGIKPESDQQQQQQQPKLAHGNGLIAKGTAGTTTAARGVREIEVILLNHPNK
jgi:hypothetical protein